MSFLDKPVQRSLCKLQSTKLIKDQLQIYKTRLAKQKLSRGQESKRENARFVFNHEAFHILYASLYHFVCA